jgi:guanine deaminase
MHRHYLQQTVDLAAKNIAEGGGPFAALIVKNREIIAVGANRVVVNNDPSAHAEIVAIRAACQHLADFQLKDCILYSSCEPCPMCLGAIYWARPAEVYYACSRFDASRAGFDDSFIYDEIPKPPAERNIPMHLIELAGAEQPFQDWRRLVTKIRY